MHSLPILLDLYPDARIVFTHRDPLAVLGSVTSLVATLRYAHSDAVDVADIGRYHADLYGRSLDRLVDLTDGGMLDTARVHHTQYADFIADPLNTLAKVFAALDRPFDRETRVAAHAHLAEVPRGAKGEHRYSFEDLCLDRGVERKRFARYQVHFGTPSEEPR
jgi:hypothetical protein